MSLAESLHYMRAGEENKGESIVFAIISEK